jgi:hypothetical protein
MVVVVNREHLVGKPAETRSQFQDVAHRYQQGNTMTSVSLALRSLFSIACFGFAAIALLASPIELSILVYWVTGNIGRSIHVGLFYLAFLTTAFIGHALLVSLRNAQEKESQSPTISDETNAPFSEIGPFEPKDVVTAWAKSLDVQQHFNDLELRIRNFAISLLVAVMGRTALALKEQYTVQIGDQQVSLAIVILLAGILGWFAFYFMDRHWYHRLLIGSVKYTPPLQLKNSSCMHSCVQRDHVINFRP